MSRIKVSWEIDFEIEDLVKRHGEKILYTEVAKRAANLALEYITDPDTEAHVFNVETNGDCFEVDLFHKQVYVKPKKSV